MFQVIVRWTAKNDRHGGTNMPNTSNVGAGPKMKSDFLETKVSKAISAAEAGVTRFSERQMSSGLFNFLTTGLESLPDRRLRNTWMATNDDGDEDACRCGRVTTQLHYQMRNVEQRARPQ